MGNAIRKFEEGDIVRFRQGWGDADTETGIITTVRDRSGYVVKGADNESSFAERVRRATPEQIKEFKTLTKPIDPRTRLRRLQELEYMLLHHADIFKPKKISFDINVWTENKYKDNYGESDDGVYKPCSTAACALGSACLYGPFNKEGLGVNPKNLNPTTPGDIDIIYVHKDTVKTEGYDAGEKFFGITAEESGWLFNPDSYTDKRGMPYDDDTIAKRYVTPARVAKRVSYLITRYKDKLPGLTDTESLDLKM